MEIYSQTSLHQLYTIEITVPVLNEEKKLREQVLKIYDFLNFEWKPETTWLLVIADNGSTDQTQEIGQQLSSEYSWIKYIRLEERGVGLALKTSWTGAQSDFVGYMDLDLATHLNHLSQALNALESGYDIVYGSRLHQNSKVIGRSFIREFTSRSFNFILRNYLHVEISDGMCGFKFLNKKTFQKLFAAGAKSNGWFFSTELLVLADWLNLNKLELPVEWTDSGESHVKIIPLAMRYIKAMRSLKKLKPVIRSRDDA